MRKSKCLYLSHTDIRFDSRILKTVQAAEDSGFCVLGMGAAAPEGTRVEGIDLKGKIVSRTLVSRKILSLRPIRHVSVFMELAIKTIPSSLRFRPRLIHCNDFMMLPVAILIKWLTGAKLIYDAHELESDRNASSKIIGRLVYLTEKSFWWCVDGLIVVSPSIKKWYLDHMGQKRALVILNSPVFSERKRVKSSYLRDYFMIPDSNRVFIYIGILARGRGIELLLEAFARIDTKAALVFLGYGEYEEKIKQWSRRYESIFFHPAVPHDEVVSVAQSADFGVCLIENVSLSYYYALPNKLFEYAFAGIPVIASNFPDLRCLIDEYQLGFCVDLNVNAIVDAIENADEKCKGYQFSPDALKELSWDTQAKNLTDFYNTILAG